MWKLWDSIITTLTWIRKCSGQGWIHENIRKIWLFEWYLLSDKRTDKEAGGKGEEDFTWEWWEWDWEEEASRKPNKFGIGSEWQG